MQYFAFDCYNFVFSHVAEARMDKILPISGMILHII